MELFDLVDEDDNVVGVTNKAEAHENKLPHRVAAVYVFDENGDLYVQIHKSSGGKFDHSVGGHVSQGETYDEAAYREADEELGIRQQLTHVSTFYSDEGSYLHIFGIYECVAEENWNFVPNDEVEEIVLMPFSEVRQLMQAEPERFTRGFLNTMKEYCRVKSKI